MSPNRQLIGWLAGSLVAVGIFLAIRAGEDPSYSNVDQIAELLRDEGLGCEQLIEPDVEPTGSGVPTSSGSCTLDEGGAQLYVFSSEEDADAWFDRGRMDTVAGAVRGETWVVVTNNEDIAERVSDALGL